MSPQVWFQSTPARGGRRHLQSLTCGRLCGFNPRPRAAGDPGYAARVSWMSAGFNPRPRAAGDDPSFGDGSTSRRSFNPRPRAAGDVACSRVNSGPFVSIHARARRATSPVRQRFGVRLQFQSTPARGGRPGTQPQSIPLACRFNPRPRAAGDSASSSSTVSSGAVSIHARARRATQALAHASND